MTTNMQKHCGHWDFVGVARLVLETRTALSIGQGPGDGLFDHGLACDANGLAAIPGSSLAGVLRHAWERIWQTERANQKGNDHGSLDAMDTSLWFGGIGEKDTHSRIRVSWGCLHDQDDRPIEGIQFDLDQRLEEDPILRDGHVGQALKRNHVRINDRGVAVDGAQFDRMVLRAGHRFSLELSMWSPEADHRPWRQLLGLLTHPEFRLGGASRSGLGAFKLIRLHQRWFHLKEPSDFGAYTQLSHSLACTRGLAEVSDQLTNHDHATLQACLKLKPIDFFCISGGLQALNDKDEVELDQTNLDFVPLTEALVSWNNGRGDINFSSPCVLLPGSSIKGALRHRVAYHAPVLSRDFIEPTAVEAASPTETREVPEQDLFGFANDDRREGNRERGRCGRLWVDDVYLPLNHFQIHELTHNSIDRFTGGVRRGALFTEQMLSSRQSFCLRIQVNRRDDGEVSPNLWKALRLALADLTEGRLAIGSGANRGNGFFSGTITWSDGGSWFDTVQSKQQECAQSKESSRKNDALGGFS